MNQQKKVLFFRHSIFYFTNVLCQIHLNSSQFPFPHTQYGLSTTIEQLKSYNCYSSYFVRGLKCWLQKIANVKKSQRSNENKYWNSLAIRRDISTFDEFYHRSAMTPVINIHPNEWMKVWLSSFHLSCQSCSCQHTDALQKWVLYMQDQCVFFNMLIWPELKG